MADDHSQDLMGYAAMEQEASRGVVKAALKYAAQHNGLPGDHHLYVTFRTRGPGVSVPADLAARYPDEMTVVLQHQFWDLAPGETFFAVTLKFGGQPKRLSVPYTAVTRFYDPSVQYLLQFEAVSTAEEGEAPAAASEVVPLHPRPAAEPARESAAESPPEPEPDPPKADGPKIVSLDTFRKK